MKFAPVYVLLLLVSLCLPSGNCEEPVELCTITDPDRSFVIGRERFCLVENRTGDHELILSWYDYHEDCDIFDRQDICPIYIGMKLNFVCPDGAEVRKVGIGQDEQIWRNSSVTIQRVDRDDAGVYECVIMNGRRAAYNITVSNGKITDV